MRMAPTMAPTAIPALTPLENPDPDDADVCLAGADGVVTTVSLTDPPEPMSLVDAAVVCA